MDADTLGRARAAIEEDAAIEAGMTPGEWHWSIPWEDGCVRSTKDGTDPDNFFHADLPEDEHDSGFCLHTPSERIADPHWHNDNTAGFGVRPADAAGIVRARNRWPAHIELARAVAVLLKDGDSIAGLMVECDRWSELYSCRFCYGAKSTTPSNLVHDSGCPALAVDTALAALADPNTEPKAVTP